MCMCMFVCLCLLAGFWRKRSACFSEEHFIFFVCNNYHPQSAQRIQTLTQSAIKRLAPPHQNEVMSQRRVQDSINLLTKRSLSHSLPIVEVGPINGGTCDDCLGYIFVWRFPPFFWALSDWIQLMAHLCIWETSAFGTCRRAEHKQWGESRFKMWGG